MRRLAWTDTGVRGAGAARGRFHLSYRTVGHIYAALAARHSGCRPRSVRLATAASVALDLALWRRMRGSDGLDLWPRLAVDTADSALWGRVMADSPEAAMHCGVPLALETGMRRGALGLVIPAAHFVAATVVRRGRHRPTPLGAVGAQAMAVGVGWALTRYGEIETERTTKQLDAALESRRATAWLAGANELATAADSVVDQLARIEYMLSVTIADPKAVRRTVADWKAQLAERTGAEASYLGVAVAQWQRARSGPDLALERRLVVDPEDATIVLSHGQARRLADALSTLDLPSTSTVSCDAEAGRRTVGDRLTLRVGPHRITLDRDDPDVQPAVDPAPIFLAAGATWCLSLGGRGHGDAPSLVVVPVAGLSVAAAAWAHRLLTASARPAVGELMTGAAVVVGGLQALAIAPLLSRPLDPGGVPVNTAGLTLLPLAMLCGLHYEDLRPEWRLAVLATAVGLVAASAALAPGGRGWGGVPNTVLELAATTASTRHMRTNFAREHALLLHARTAEDDQAVDTARADGRRAVITLVRRATEELRALVDDQADLPADLRPELERRLSMAEHDMAAIG